MQERQLRSGASWRPLRSIGADYSAIHCNSDCSWQQEPPTALKNTVIGRSNAFERAMATCERLALGQPRQRRRRGSAKSWPLQVREMGRSHKRRRVDGKGEHLPLIARDSCSCRRSSILGFGAELATALCKSECADWITMRLSAHPSGGSLGGWRKFRPPRQLTERARDGRQRCVGETLRMQMSLSCGPFIRVSSAAPRCSSSGKGASNKRRR